MAVALDQVPILEPMKLHERVLLLFLIAVECGANVSEFFVVPGGRSATAHGRRQQHQ